MSYRNTVLFKKSLLAIAVVSLSACSTTQRVQDYDLSRIGAGILDAGRTTADVSQRAWNKTTYLLGFSDEEMRTDEGLLMDDVDVAMLEEDAVMPDGTTIRPVVIQRATPTEQTPTNPLVALQDQTPINLNDGSSVQTGLSNAVAADQPAVSEAEVTTDPIGQEDLIHEVAANETLWDISKATTGDATNWHLLADVNNLGPNASVFPGQQLIIPGDMLKPEYDETTLDTQNSETASLQVDLKQQDDNQAASEQRLEIPEADDSSELAETQPQGRPFKLEQGETLWDFAKRTTGDATNWQAIAGENDFSEKQAVIVRPGQTIYVPEDLVRPELDLADSTKQTPTLAPIPATEVAVSSNASGKTSDQNAIEASSQLLSEASAQDETQPILDETQPIKIVEATFKADDSLAPIAVAPLAEEAVELAAASKPEKIMVSGTYYPKAIYNDADFSSSLLMRVSPGTTLQVSKAMGAWFEVTTDKGVGYVHQRDIK